jgi:ectoine hydroxylase-related dioxygenase (phytanoyl-CoA dioxygenase family)
MSGSIDLSRDGFTLLPGVLDDARCDALASNLSSLDFEGAGSRRLLDAAWCRDLAQELRSHAAVSALLGNSTVAVQCTYFDKSPDQNWLVAMHQDLSIPVRNRVADTSCVGWSEKEGGLYVQPPTSVLEELLAIRVHVDASGPDNGPLRVVPRSHCRGRLSTDSGRSLADALGEHVCTISRGGVIALRPLLLHASSKSLRAEARRVLHFVFGPKVLPFGLEWSSAV